ncbi:hypothetical protein ACVIVD_008390 [Bradyrhizobium liaoningense]
MPDAERRKSITLSREELYALVWAMPMSRLAVQYGLSGACGICLVWSKLPEGSPKKTYPGANKQWKCRHPRMRGVLRAKSFTRWSGRNR